MITENDIKKALSAIIDPDFKKDIVSLGFVKNILIEGTHVSCDIELTTPACPIKSEFQESAQNILRALPGVDHVEVRMTAKSKSHSFRVENSGLAKVQNLIAVSSCKGGVGKSTLAAHLARDLARRGHRVGLLDADLFGPSIPTLFNLHNINLYMTPDKRMIPHDVEGLKILSFGFLLGDSPAILRGPIVSNYIQQLLHKTEWGELDYLFIDMPPGTGDIQLTITQSAELDGAVIVTTPHTLSLVDVAKGILMFERVNVPILGIIENMAYFECDACAKKHAIFGKKSGVSLTEKFGVPTLATLPIISAQSSEIAHQLPAGMITEMVDQVVRAIGKNRIEKSEKPNVSHDETFISLSWPQGESLKVSHRDLRLSCQCALCVDEMTGRKILSPQQVSPDIQPKDIQPLGNYALSITWSDGHSSGIYPYPHIRELALKSE